jgi:exosortase
VEEACSGMRLLITIFTLGVAMAYLGDRPAWQRIVMVLVTIPIAIFCNVIRVTATGVAFVNGHNELASGTPHQVAGIVTLGIALGLIALVGYVLSHLFVDELEEDPAAPNAD